MKYHNKTIDSKREWNSFLHQTNQWAFFQAWEWGEIHKTNRCNVYRYGIYKEDALICVYQVIKIVARRGTYLHVRHGPVMDMLDQSVMKFIRDELISLARKESADFIRLNPMIEDSEDHRSMMRKLGFVPSQLHAMDAELCWVLDITQPEETLLSHMRKTTRYEIRRALQQGVQVRISTNLDDLTHFKKLYDITAKRHKFVKHDAIDKEFAEFVKSDQAILLLGSYQGEITTASIVIFWGNQAIYHHGASVPSKFGISYAVQWCAIQEAKKRGKKIYNFWGIAPDDNINHPWRGITLFKKGFGGREFKYIHTHDLPVTWRYWFVRMIEFIRKVHKGY